MSSFQTTEDPGTALATEQQPRHTAAGSSPDPSGNSAASSYASTLLARLAHRLSRTSREQFLVVLLDEHGAVIDLVALADGTSHGAGVNPRDVVRLVLDRDAAEVIFIHNHPAGDAVPSERDRRLTARLQQACRSIDVQVRDHLIISGGGTYSFAAAGLL